MSSSSIEALAVPQQQAIHNMVRALKRKEISGAYGCARATVSLYLDILEEYEWQSTKEAMSLVRTIAHLLQNAAPAELTIGNIARRTLRIIREAYADACKGEIDTEQLKSLDVLSLKASAIAIEQGPSLSNILGEDLGDFSKSFDIQNPVLQELDSLKEELAVVYKDISKQARDHIHANEVILTYGHSSSVEGFLKQAAAYRTFEVVVAEGLPEGTGRYMADRLSKAGIKTTLIPDSAVFAIMPRINKVLSGVHCVMANGVLLAITGTHLLALAARHYSVPFVVLTGLYKLCPLYPYPSDMDMYCNFGSPADTLSFRELSYDQNPRVKVPSPLYEYVPAELVTLYISEQAHNPSFLHRLLSEYYHPEDYEL